jgi:Tol biopolymer transport system component
VTTAVPWITTDDLETHLGVILDPELADRLCWTASTTVASAVNLVDATGAALTAVPDAVMTVTLYVAAELYKAGQGIDGTLQVDWTQTVPASISSVLVRRYSALLAPWANLSGMVG